MIANDEEAINETTKLVEQRGDDGVAIGNVLRWVGALTVVFLLAMEAMGYQALLPALYASGQFEWLCSDEEKANATGGNSEAVCDAQQEKLDLMFTLGYVGLNVAAFPLAVLLHHYPPRYITAAAFMCKSIAYCLMALGTDGAGPWLGDDKFQYLSLVAYTLIASLGLSASLPFLNLPPLLFPPVYIGLANTSLMGSADASSFMYYVIRELYLNTGLTLRVMFLGYAGVTALGAVFSYKLLKPLGIPRDDIDEAEPVLKRVFSRKFGVITAWHSAFFVMKYFYMTNITAEGYWMTGSHDEAYHLNTAFSVIMPATGILTPVVGWILSKGLRPAILVNTVLATTIAVASSIHSYPLGYVMLVAVASSRFMVFSIIPTLMAHPKAFGVEGSVFFSITTGIAGAVSMGNFALSAWARHMDMYTPINLALGGCCLAATFTLYTFLTKAGIP